MPTYITFNALGDDSIRIFLSDPIVVGLCAREDFAKLTEIEEVHKPGIYVLMNKEGKRYVGQATGGVHSRLNSHEKNKDWWTELVFIAHAYGALSPDKLNYLEAKLIADFKRLNYDMDNGNGGNQNSYIGTPQKLEAERFLHDALEALVTVAQRDLYLPNRKLRSKVSAAAPRETPPSEVVDPLNRTKQQKQYGLTNFVPPFTLKDSENRTLVSDQLLGSTDSLYFAWMSELSKDADKASKMLENFTASWLFQGENDDHRNEVPRAYLGGHNGLYIHVPAVGYPLSATRDILRVSNLLNLEVSITDSHGADMLAAVQLSNIKRIRKCAAPTTFTISGSLGNEFRSNTLGGQSGVYGQWLSALAKKPELLGKMFEIAHDSRTRHLKVSETDPSPEGKAFYLRVADKLWVYVTLSKGNTYESVETLSKKLGIEAEITEELLDATSDSKQ